ncbi:hypothetical protein J1N35_029309 [Gossypium stocksii]|uniref:Uncharacterized protein n=1 Tax=Gossypium stocksii TaxID=47602 RepID=A0A9D3UXK6_9ROSI|nr:hypothetical protein J1N35_029309 [Gossypium stocksii]
MLNDNQLVRKEKANLVVTSSSKGKGKHTKRNKAKFSRPPKIERKRTKKPKNLSKSKCFFYIKKWHFKKTAKGFEEMKNLRDKNLSL